MPPPPFPDDLGNISNRLPLFQVKFFAPTNSSQHTPGFTLSQHYLNTSSVPLAVPKTRSTAYLPLPMAPMFVAPPPPESLTYVVCLTIMLPQSASEPKFKILEGQHYAPEPTLKMNDLYCYNQPLAFHFDTEKPVVT